MKRNPTDNFDHGFSEVVWESAKSEARQAMIAAAARGDLIAYSELVNKIEACRLEPQSSRLAHMLGEISSEEHLAGRGMLSVVVVHKHGDGMPGSGFFKLARSLGQDVDDRLVFWIQELEKVYKTWSSVPKRDG